MLRGKFADFVKGLLGRIRNARCFLSIYKPAGAHDKAGSFRAGHIEYAFEFSISFFCCQLGGFAVKTHPRKCGLCSE